MDKISITLDLTKINKSKIVSRSYENKSGEIIHVKEYKIEVIPLKEKKLLKECSNGSNMVKTHFVVEQQTKDERDARKDSVYVGEGIQFEEGGEGSQDW